MTAFRISFISAFGVLIVCINISGELYEGSPCTMMSGKAGVCVKLTECKSIDDALRKRKYDFKNLIICTFVGTEEVICCPDKVNVSTVNPSVLILNQTQPGDHNTLNVSKSFDGRTTQTVKGKSSTQSLNVEKEVTVGGIHINEQAEFIDLTKLIQNPPGASNGRQAKLGTTPHRTTSSSTISSTTKRPSAKVRDLYPSDSTTRRSTVSASTTQRVTFLKPVKDLAFHQVLTDIERPDYRKNDIKPWTQRPEYVPTPSRSPYWSGYNWRAPMTQTFKTKTTTDRPMMYHARPSIDEVDFHEVPEEQSEFPRYANGAKPLPSLWTSTTRQITRRPSSSFVFDSEGDSNEDSSSNIVFPSSSYSSARQPSFSTESRPRVVSQSNGLTTPGIVWPIANTTVSNSNLSTNSIPSAITSVLDEWMINVLLEASGSTTILSPVKPSSSSSSTSSSSLPSPTVEQSAEAPFSPDDNNVISSSSTPRNPGATPSVPGSRVAERKADKVCAQYQQDYLNLPRLLDFNIIEGDPAMIGEFPHMAALGYDGEQGGRTVIMFNCGGTLISNRYVITAAHCVNRPEALPTLIRLGTLHLDEPFDELMDVGVEGVVLYPEYRSNRQYHDIALIRLNTTLTFNSRLIFPACLDSDRRDVQPNQNVIATGWGSTNTSTRRKSSLLLKVELSTVELSDCNERHKNYAHNRQVPDGLNDGQMCAVDLSTTIGPRKDTCEGDSGGPLQVKLVNISKIIGVTSFGISCGSDIPSVYARVAFYLDWLERIVWPDLTV